MKQDVRKRLNASNTSTSCSTPPPHDIRSLLVTEENRYLRKGYGLITSSAMVFTFMYFMPDFGQWLWPQVLDYLHAHNIPYWQAFIAITLGLELVFVLISNLVMWGIYHIELPFFERYKINREEPWPWNKNPEAWSHLIKKTLALVSFNMLVMLPLVLVVHVVADNWNCKYSFEVKDLPDTKTLIFTLIFCMMCEDFSFHFLHKLLHWRMIYPYIHKIHHQHTSTIGIAAEYAHPLEFVFGNVLPASIGPMLLGSNMHFYTFLLWVLMRLGETIDGHSGYEFSWSPYRLLILSTSASYHEFHHSYNVGNYSSFFSLWDTVFGTNQVFYQHQQRLQDARRAALAQQKNFQAQLSQKLYEQKLENPSPSPLMSKED